MANSSFKASGLLAIGAGLALLALNGGCSHTPAGGAHATLIIVRTNFLGSLWSEAQAQAKVISQDGGQSFAVPGGALWAFGDTFKGSRQPDGTPLFAGGAVSCSVALLKPAGRTHPPALDYLCSTNGVISPFTLLPTETPPERYRIWPLGGIYVNGRAYLYYSLIEVFGTGSWDFRGLGSGLARATNALGTYDRLSPNGHWRLPVAPAQVLEADGWLYLFSIGEYHGRQGVGLARVRPERIEEPDTYEFYAGPGPRFSTNPATAAALVKDIPGQVSVAWNAYLHKYVMASSSDFFHPREIQFRTADTPAGPWSPPVARVLVPEKRQGKPVELVYCTYLHPELFRENGRVMNLTYSLNLKDSGFDANCEMVEITVKAR